MHLASLKQPSLLVKTGSEARAAFMQRKKLYFYFFFFSIFTTFVAVNYT